MKRSKYNYFFEEEVDYIGFSTLSNDFVSFNITKKNIIENILNHPDEILTGEEVDIYRELASKLFIIPDSMDEYKQMIELHRKSIYRQDKIMFTICPTMACNFRCKYCYEAHADYKESKISRTVIDNLKRLIESKIEKTKECSIIWFGGEPLYCPDVIEEINGFCIDLCNKNNVMFSTGMSSNFGLATKEVAEMLTRVKLNSIQVTLDGYKENHDKLRISKNNKGTWDLIIKNILYYLNYDKRNSITIRVHFPNNSPLEYLHKTLNDLQIFDQSLRKRIGVYPHAIFSSCTDAWDKGKENKKETKTTEPAKSPVNFNAILDQFRKEVYKLGFRTSIFSIKPYYCEADLDYFWTVRPDGYLSKCTVALEKERSQAKLNDKGIKIFSHKLLDFKKKDFSMALYNDCKDCSFLPFCWRGCGFSLAEDITIDQELQRNCKFKHNNWMLERQMDNIKYKYLEQKRNLQSHES